MMNSPAPLFERTGARSTPPAAAPLSSIRISSAATSTSPACASAAARGLRRAPHSKSCRKRAAEPCPSDMLIAMKVGVFTALLSQFPLDRVIEKLKKLEIDTVELGTGNYPGGPHCPLSMLNNDGELREFRKKLDGNGFSISALSCHGNPLHPNADIAKGFIETSRNTILLAEKLGVGVVVDFSGCPGASDNDKYPNWITCPWPPDVLEALDWQWNERVLPYWTKHAKFAADHGVKIAIEMHPGFVCYSPETMLRLRDACGKNIGVNYDPSHMFWQ